MTFLEISPEFFKIDMRFTFSVFIKDPHSKERSVFLYPDTAINQHALENMNNYAQKGSHFQIYFDDYEDYLEALDLEFDVIYQKNKLFFDMLEKEQHRHHEYSLLAEEKIIFKNELKTAIQADDFTSLILRMRAQISMFSVRQSSEQSSMIRLLETLLNTDTPFIREMCFAYFFAKHNKITSEYELCCLVMAIMLKDLGLSQLKLADKFEDFMFQEYYEKHPLLTYFLLSKSRDEIPKLVKRIILEHHELIDGQGFPRGKKEDHLHRLSFIAHMSDEIFKTTQGLYGSAMDIYSIFRIMGRGNVNDRVEVKFPMDLYQSLLSLIPKKDDDEY